MPAAYSPLCAAWPRQLAQIEARYSDEQPIASLTPREPSLPRSQGARNCRIAQSVGAYRGNSCCSIFHLGGPDNYMLDARIFHSHPFDLPPHQFKRLQES